MRKGLAIVNTPFENQETNLRNENYSQIPGLKPAHAIRRLIQMANELEKKYIVNSADDLRRAAVTIQLQDAKLENLIIACEIAHAHVSPPMQPNIYRLLESAIKEAKL
jgi:hypothetical protein